MTTPFDTTAFNAALARIAPLRANIRRCASTQMIRDAIIEAL